MPATISIPAGAAARTAAIAHSLGAGPSTISISAAIMRIANSIAPGIVLSSVAVPNTLSAAAAFTGTTATIVTSGSTGAVFTIVGPGRMIDTLPIGAQLVFSGSNSGVLITNYVSPTTYVVATTPSSSTYTLVTLEGSPVFTSGSATGTVNCVINLASSTGVTLPTATMAASGAVTSTALGTALVAGTPVTLSGTISGGTINGGDSSAQGTFYVAATPAPTTTSYSLIDSNGAPLVVVFSGSSTSLTGIIYTATILNSPLTSVGLNASTGISTTTGLVYTVGTAIQVTGTLTAVSGQGTISPYESGQIYLIGASSSGTATLTTLKSSVPVVLTTGTSVGLTFTVLPSAVALSGQTGTILTANAFSTVTPTNAAWTYLWQELNTTTGDYATVVGNTHFTGATTITLTMASSIAIADTGIYRCQITPTGTGVASGAPAINSLPIFLRIATTA